MLIVMAEMMEVHWSVHLEELFLILIYGQPQTLPLLLQILWLELIPLLLLIV